MTSALYTLAALLTGLRAFDVWSTYQILKYGGYEKTRVTKWLMDKIGVYPALCFFFVQFVGGAWAVALAPLAFPAEAWLIDYCAVTMVGLVMLYVWVSVGNWQALQEQKGKVP